MFANCYGYDGVDKAIKLLINEIVQDGWNVGINSLADLDINFVSSLVPESRKLVLSHVLTVPIA